MTWTRRPLKEVAEFCLGKMLDENKNRGQSMPYLANINVRWGRFDLGDLRQMRFEENELDRFGLSYGDIVMCEGGEPGRCAVWQDQLPGMMFQKALHRIRPHEDIDSRFLFYLFLKMGRNDEFGGLFTGSTIKHLPKEKLAKVVVAFPELKVQQHIAEVLFRYDDLIENNRRRIALLEQAARLLYEEWFVRFRFPGHEHAKVVNGLPEGWAEQHLAQLCDGDDGIQTGPFGSQLHQSDYSDDGIPVVMPKNMIAFRIVSDGIARIPEQTAERLTRHRLIEGDTVYGRRGDIGRRAYVSEREVGWLCGTGCLRMRPNNQKIDPRFLFDALGAPKTAGTIANRAKGATLPNLNSTILRSVPVLVPSRPMQELYSSKIRPIKSQIETLAAYNEKLGAARDLLLPRLMSGEVEV